MPLVSRLAGLRHPVARSRSRAAVVLGAGTIILLAACTAPAEDTARSAAPPPRVAGTVYAVRDTTLDATFDAAGIAEPLRQATLSTKLMGSVTAVLVKEGDVVAAGQPLVRIDARDLAAKAAQTSAAIAEAEAMRARGGDAGDRIRALYADSAATRAQLDAVETGLTRADAGVRAARAAAAELQAVSSYADVRAPFAGVVTQRFVDPGAFAAPGAPLVSVQDAAHAARGRRARRRRPRAGCGAAQHVAATIEGRAVRRRWWRAWCRRRRAICTRQCDRSESQGRRRRPRTPRRQRRHALPAAGLARRARGAVARRGARRATSPA